MRENAQECRGIMDTHHSSHEKVALGTKVTIVEDANPPEVYHIVNAAEADPAHGKISDESPLGKALLGRHEGDSVQVKAPDGLLTFHIAAIK